MLSKSKLRKNQNFATKLCNNKLLFSPPIIDVEEKPKFSTKTMQQLTTIFASDY
jgi:hypothetical protein